MFLQQTETGGGPRRGASRPALTDSTADSESKPTANSANSTISEILLCWVEPVFAGDRHHPLPTAPETLPDTFSR
jgi:hypothetical protein